MNEIATLAAVIGLSTGLLTLLGGLWKVFNLVSSLQRRDDALQNDIEALELVVNGLNGRLEHLKKRFTDRINSQGVVLRDCEGWLIKHTDYERRSRDEVDSHSNSID
jgi:hypothetical protein